MDTTAEIYYRIQHRHKDGSWGEMQEAANNPAAADPERWWGLGKLFRCTSCDEGVTVVPPGHDTPTPNEG